MYYPGELVNFELRLHQSPVNVDDLANFESEGWSYTGTWTTHQYYKLNNEIRKKVYSITNSGTFLTKNFWTTVSWLTGTSPESVLSIYTGPFNLLANGKYFTFLLNTIDGLVTYNIGQTPLDSGVSSIALKSNDENYYNLGAYSGDGVISIEIGQDSQPSGYTYARVQSDDNFYYQVDFVTIDDVVNIRIGQSPLYNFGYSGSFYLRATGTNGYFRLLMITEDGYTDYAVDQTYSSTGIEYLDLMSNNGSGYRLFMDSGVEGISLVLDQIPVVTGYNYAAIQSDDNNYYKLDLSTENGITTWNIYQNPL